MCLSTFIIIVQLPLFLRLTKMANDDPIQIKIEIVGCLKPITENYLPIIIY